MPEVHTIRHSGGSLVSATKQYSRRLFLTYQELIESRSGRRDLEKAVRDYAAANKGVDLEQPLTFRQWFAENKPTRAAHAR